MISMNVSRRAFETPKAVPMGGLETKQKLAAYRSPSGSTMIHISNLSK